MGILENLKLTKECFGSTRSQVRILSPRLNQNQVILASYPDSLFYWKNLSDIKADKLRTN